MGSAAILLVEDNPLTRGVLVEMLRSGGYEVWEAPDGRTALSLAARQAPALVLQDLALPDMEGVELLRRLRKELGKTNSKHCGGCHDMPLVVDGMMTEGDIPPDDLRSHTGVSCRLCHGIQSVTKDGNGSYVWSRTPIDAPTLGDAASIAAHKKQVAIPIANLGTELCVGCHRGFLSNDMNMPVHLSGLDEPGMWRNSAYTGNGMGRIDKVGYDELLKEAKDFLSGKSDAVQRKIERQMQDAAENLDFEAAAMLRDRLRAATFIQGSQAVNAEGVGDADVFALAAKGGQIAVQGFFIRGGQNWGHRAFFPTHTQDVGEDEVLARVLAQFYEEVPPPRTILVDRELPERELLEQALCELAGRKVDISIPQRGDRRRLLAQASRNAAEALDRRLAESGTQARTWREMSEFLELPDLPDRLEADFFAEPDRLRREVDFFDDPDSFLSSPVS